MPTVTTIEGAAPRRRRRRKAKDNDVLTASLGRFSAASKRCRKRAKKGARYGACMRDELHFD